MNRDKNMTLWLVNFMWFPCGSCDSAIIFPARKRKCHRLPEQNKLNTSNSKWIKSSYRAGLVIFSCRHRRCLGQWPESSSICMYTMDPRIKSSLLCFSSPVPAGHWLPTIPSLNHAVNVLSVLNKCISSALVFRSMMDGCMRWKIRLRSFWERLPVSYLLASLIKSALFCGKELSRKSFLTLCQVRLSFSVKLWASNGSKSSLSTDAVLQDPCLVCWSTKAISWGLQRIR